MGHLMFSSRKYLRTKQHIRDSPGADVAGVSPVPVQMWQW
jgi:hypothetical protein